MRRSLRFIARTLLVCLLAMVSLYAWRVYSRPQPNTDWQQAQTALAAGDRNTAVVLLRKVVAANPNHGEAYLAVSQLFLDHAKFNGQPATYAENERAFTFLKQAGRLLPQNTRVQQTLLALHLDKRQIPEAIEVAGRLAAQLPNDPDVLAALSYRAVSQYEQTTAELKKLTAAGEPAHFQALYIRAKLDLAAENTTHLQALLDDAVERAEREGRRRTALFQPRERIAMAELLALAVRESTDAATAQRRTDTALHAWEEAAATDGPDATRKAVIGQAADEGTRLVAIYAETFDRRDAAFADRAEALRQTAFAADAASTAARMSSVRRAYDRGELLRAAETAEAGVSFAENRREVFALRRTAARLFIAAGSERAEPQIQALLDDREWRGWGRLLAGDRALSLGRAEAALDEYRAALPLLGHTRDVQAALADAYFAVGRWDEAQAELAGLARRRPSPEGASADGDFPSEPSHRPLLLKLYEFYRGVSQNDTASAATAAL